MKNTTIWGIVAGAATATAVLMTYRKKDGSRLADGLINTAKQFGNKIKDRLQHHIKGPNGEPVYLDMYDRQFYEDFEGKRVYLDVH